MSTPDRRQFLIAAAASVGASLVITGPAGAATNVRGIARDRFPEGVASADPQPDNVLLWTRCPPRTGRAADLQVEVSEYDDFRTVIARDQVTPLTEADWTCRVLVGGLKPSTTYWYRFIDADGYASRTGRTFTAPNERDTAPVRFAFVSCQNINIGHATPLRRMLVEDMARPEAEQLQFVLHLGDFIYEMIWSPADQPQVQGRTVNEIGPLPTGRRVGTIQVPTTIEDYRHVYRAYLADRDIQDARARWPFICIWDNHEFSNRCFQSQINYDDPVPAQSLKVAANQAWFEYIPARVTGTTDGLRRFLPPEVSDTPLVDIDDHGLSHEPNNLAAINSLSVYRALRWGANVELILTDNRSFKSQSVAEQDIAAPFMPRGFPWYAPQDVIEVLDAGRDYPGGAPDTLTYNGEAVPNPARDKPAGSILGQRQKQWFKERLAGSTARWKLWGNSFGMLHRRTDFQNLPDGFEPKWPSAGYALSGTDDWCGYPAERRELLNFAKDQGVTNLVSLVGDRHAFFAGYLSPDLPPQDYAPVAVEFVVGSISTPSVFQAAEAALPLDRPLSPFYLARKNGEGPVLPAMNMAVRYGVESCREYARSGDIEAAKSVRNPDVAPHLAFADQGGHGFAILTATPDDLRVEFIGTVRPDHPATTPDGIEVSYRIAHRVAPWAKGKQPRLEHLGTEGHADLVTDL